MAREFELSTPVDGTLDQAWAVITDFEAYPQWNRLVPFASGETVPGARVLLRVRGLLLDGTDDAAPRSSHRPDFSDANFIRSV